MGPIPKPILKRRWYAYAGVLRVHFQTLLSVEVFCKSVAAKCGSTLPVLGSLFSWKSFSFNSLAG